MRRGAVAVAALAFAAGTFAGCAGAGDPIQSALLTRVQQIRDAALSGDATTAREQLHVLEGSVEQNRDRGVLSEGHAAEILDAVATVDLLLVDAIDAQSPPASSTTTSTTTPDDDLDDEGDDEGDGRGNGGHGKGNGGKHED